MRRYRIEFISTPHFDKNLISTFCHANSIQEAQEYARKMAGDYRVSVTDDEPVNKVKKEI